MHEKGFFQLLIDVMLFHFSWNLVTNSTNHTYNIIIIQFISRPDQMAGDTHPFTLDSFWSENISSCWERHRIDPPEQHANSLNPFISIMLTAGTHAGSSFHRKECAARKHLKVICLHLLMPLCTDVLSLNLRKAVTAPFYSATFHRGSLSSEQHTEVQNESGLL